MDIWDFLSRKRSFDDIVPIDTVIMIANILIDLRKFWGGENPRAPSPLYETLPECILEFVKLEYPYCI